MDFHMLFLISHLIYISYSAQNRQFLCNYYDRVVNFQALNLYEQCLVYEYIQYQKLSVSTFWLPLLLLNAYF